MKPTLYLSLMAIVAATHALAQQVTFYSATTVRVTQEAPTPSATPQLSLVVTARPGAVSVKTSQRDGVTTYRSSALSVSVDHATGHVSFSDPGGRRLLTVERATFQPIADGPDRGRYRVGQTFAIDKDEPIYGLGMLQNGKLNQRGEHRRMMQSNLEDYSHFFQSINGWGIYWDNYSPTRIDDSDRGLTLLSEVGTRADFYFIYGGTADGVIRGMRQLTGHVPMLPLWTYGFHQSRERYKTAAELLDVVDTYRRTGVPFDGIIQDWQYWDNNYLWNAMDFLAEGFKQHRDMIRRVHEQHAHISLSIWASFGPETKAFRQLQQKGLLYSFETWPQSGLPAWPPNMDYPSGVRVYDAYSREARDIYWQHLQRLHALGIDAWWMDSTDPDHHSFSESDLDEMKPATDPATGRDVLTSWRSVRNAFPLCTVEGVYQHQRQADTLHRPFILTRSYFAGQQRTGANTWSGDIGSSWENLRRQVPLCLSHTLTANPNVNTDIGGFFANAYNRRNADNSATRNPLFQELYVRWMQFGVFCPMMRSHGTEVWRELYHYGQAGQPVYDALLAAVKLRYRLLPYIYSQSWQVSQNDDSFMRALMMDFAGDTAVWNLGSEFMFGPALLVAPVLRALYTPETANDTNPISGWDSSRRTLFQEGFRADWSAPKTYPVYLPKGAAWYDYWTGRRFDGGQTIEADAPLDHAPLYVRAGSIVPLCQGDPMWASVADWQTLDIAVYPGRNATFTLYEDEGDGFGYERGRRSTITMTWNDAGHRLTIGRREGSFPGMAQQRTFVVRLPGRQPKTVSYTGRAVSVKL